jgi:hypothetical protein
LNKAKGAWHIDFGKRTDILWIMEDTKPRNIEGDIFVDFPRIAEEHRWGLEFPALPAHCRLLEFIILTTKLNKAATWDPSFWPKQKVRGTLILVRERIYYGLWKIRSLGTSKGTDLLTFQELLRNIDGV